ncbi:Hypoxanthine-guanine phosphoribosyltransferase [Fasciola gigantica]|uniref:Hypoxanthine-guanine phosphoribosyltransferase n=1 Tax=Fasciola gigantica TaxID=46835 RepID=A0A504YWI7_FASGI|nr:Hypoxanthine-guanine phosphoribosyltransferase [Fasciola gigantica]
MLISFNTLVEFRATKTYVAITRFVIKTAILESYDALHFGSEFYGCWFALMIGLNVMVVMFSSFAALINNHETEIIVFFLILLVFWFTFLAAFQLEDNYEGFPAEYFCVCPRYANYVTNVLIPNGMIKDRIEKLALDIVTSLEKDNARSVTLLCVLKGGFKFLGDLIAALESTIRARETMLPLSVDFVRIKSYVNDKSAHEPVLTGLENPGQLAGKVMRTIYFFAMPLSLGPVGGRGHHRYWENYELSTWLLEETFSTVHPSRQICTLSDPFCLSITTADKGGGGLLLKRTPLSNGYRPDFIGFEIPDRFVVGYAFDYNDHFRDMQSAISRDPFLWTMRPMNRYQWCSWSNDIPVNHFTYLCLYSR